MTKPAFTPGPWCIGRLADEKLTHVVDMGNPPKAPFAVVHSDGPREEVEANARLIAAAPVLYEALRRIGEPEDNERSLMPSEMRMIARSALKQARGEA